MEPITVKKDDAGQRLDRFLRKVLLNVPLAHIYRCIRTKRIKVNGKRAWADTKLYEKDEIRIFLPKGEIVEKERPDLSRLKDTRFFKDHFIILHEDADVLVLNKPAGLVVHPGTKYKEGQTLIDLIRSYLGIADAATFQPSLVHRLDKDTSGVILAAKNAQALRSLTDQLRHGGFHKEYLALVAGKMETGNGVIELPLLRTRDAERGGKVRVADERDEKAREARTEFRTVLDLESYALLSLLLQTGRTHQIRVHLAAEGHPIVGDGDYGSAPVNQYIERLTGLRRQFLHAWKLRFSHPLTGRPLALEAPLGEDLTQCLKILGWDGHF